MRRRIGDASHSRSASVILLALLIAAAAVVTSGFRNGRNLLFRDDSAGLVMVVQPIPFMGGSARMPAAQAQAWLQESRTVSELGLWSIEDGVRGGRHIRVCKADAVARELLAEAPVKPRYERIEAVGSHAPSFAAVVTRLRSGTSPQEAEQELARTVRLHKGWVPPRIVSLVAVRKAPLAPVGSVLLGLLLLSTFAVRAITIRAWMWAVSKIALSFALIGGLWIEFVARAPFTETAGVPAAWNGLSYLFPLFAGCCAAWWLRRDARHHCPVCYGPLTMPVSVGVPGGCLFEPDGTEYLCGAGHGALLVGPIAEQMGGERWATWSDSWA